MIQRHSLGSLLVLSLVVGISACGSSIDGEGGGGLDVGGGTVVMGGNQTPSGDGQTPATGATGVDGQPGGGTTNFEGVDGTTGETDPLSAENACAALSVMPEEVVTEVPREITTEVEIEVQAPVALYIVLDNSGSMNDPAGGNAGGMSKWDVAVGAITDFVNDPASEGIDVAIQYFHPIGVPNNANECDGTGHNVSAVPIGALPGNAANIIDSLASTGPNGNTPTVGSLTGGTDFCNTFQAQNPDEQCVTVLVTDGQPNGCGLNSQCPAGMAMADCVDPTAASVLTPIAATALANGVTTFTIGMAGVTPEGFALLDAIAVAGGSDCTPGAAGAETCDVSTTGATGFLDALNTIRDTITIVETTTETITETVYEPVVLPCDFQVPPPSTGDPIDEDRVVVKLNLNAAGQEDLVKSADEASCSGDGWFFPDPTNLTLISACPATCDRITSATSAQVEVLLGCTPELQ